MYLLGVYLSNYYDWCHAFSNRNPRWVGIACLFGLFILVCVLASFLPGWASALILLVSSPFTFLFMMAHQRVWQKRDQVARDRHEQLRNTKKLIDLFKK